MKRGNELLKDLENKKDWYDTIENTFVQKTLPQMLSEAVSNKDGLKFRVISGLNSNLHAHIFNSQNEKIRSVHFETFEEMGAEKDIICYIAAHSYNTKGDLVSRLVLPFQTCLDDPFRLIDSIMLSL